MSQPSPVVDNFYGLTEVAERIDDEHANRWLGALVLLLSHEIGDHDRVVVLAEEAALSIKPNTEDTEEKL